MRAGAQHRGGIGALSAGENKVVFWVNVLRLRDDLDIDIAHGAPDCTGPAILTPLLDSFRTRSSRTFLATSPNLDRSLIIVSGSSIPAPRTDSFAALLRGTMMAKDEPRAKRQPTLACSTRLIDIPLVPTDF